MSYNNRNNRNRTNNSTHLLTKNLDFKKSKVGDVTMQGKIGEAHEGNYLRQYHELQKEARVWYSQSQVKLAREAERRAHCLLTGNLDGYQKQVHSEHLFTPTWKFKHIIDYHNGGSN
jgi:hypothetical protein